MLPFHGLWSPLMTCLSLLRYVTNRPSLWPSRRHSRRPCFSFFCHCEWWSKQNQQEVGETFPPPWKGKGNLKSSSNKPGLCPLSFQPYENCMAVYSTRACTYQSHDVIMWYWGFISMFYVWFQTGNAWIITARNSDIFRGSLYLKVLMCLTSLWV